MVGFISAARCGVFLLALAVAGAAAGGTVGEVFDACRAQQRRARPVLPVLHEHRADVGVWRAAAQAGDPQAQWLMGHACREGLVDAGADEAEQWFRQSAEANFGPAWTELAMLVEAGLDRSLFAPPDEELLRIRDEYFRKAADLGDRRAAAKLAAGRLIRDRAAGVPYGPEHREAMFQLEGAAHKGWTMAAVSYATELSLGSKGRVDLREVKRFIEKAARGGNLAAAATIVLEASRDVEGQAALFTPREAGELADELIDAGEPAGRLIKAALAAGGVGRVADQAEAARQVDALAAADDVDYQLQAADAYLYGKVPGLPVDRERGIAILRRAAQTRYPPALVALADALRRHDGDADEIIALLREAADLGSRLARTTLVACQYEGLGVEKDRPAAFRAAMRLARRHQDPHAQYLVGLCYLDGDAVDRDLTKALEWFLRSAEAGNADGMLSAGKRYELGQGTAKDLRQAFVWYSRAADAGSVDGLYSVGRFYVDGVGAEVGIPRDLDLGIALWEQAAARGDKVAASLLPGARAKRLADGADGNKNPLQDAADGLRAVAGRLNLAREKEAAGRGDAWAAYALALRYLHGDGVAKDAAEADRLLRVASEATDDDGRHLDGPCAELAALHFYGRVDEPDLAVGLAAARRGVASNGGRSAHLLAQAHHFGWGVAADRAEALRYADLAAELGEIEGLAFAGALRAAGESPDEQRRGEAQLLEAVDGNSAFAMLMLGRSYAYADLPGGDRAEGRRLLEAALDAGTGEAGRWLGLIYNHGQGVEQDYARGLAHLRRAAELGDAGAMNEIGTMYEFGRAVAQDYAAAATWYRRAADAGEAQAMCNLGVLHLKGKGVVQSTGRALELIRRAADLGHEVGLYQLGLLHIMGADMPKDVRKGVELLQRSARLGHEPAQEKLRQNGVSW